MKKVFVTLDIKIPGHFIAWLVCFDSLHFLITSLVFLRGQIQSVVVHGGLC